MLTKSLSLSLMALFIAGWFWLTDGWRWHKAILVSIVALLWTFSRDTNAWVILMIALFLLLLSALRQIDRKYLLLSVAFMILFFLSNLSADHGDRWVFPFQNVLGQRVLPNAQAVDFFTNCGMPISPALMQFTGGYANSLDRGFYGDPALADYRLWLYGSGKSCYVKWLLANPLKSIREPIAEFSSLMTLEDVRSFLFSRTFSPILPARLEAILYPHQAPLLLFAIEAGIILIAILTRAWLQNKGWWVVIGLILLIFPHYFITWHGDVMGIYRHVLAVSIQFNLGTWLLVLFVVDTVLSFRTIPTSTIDQFVVRIAKL